MIESVTTYQGGNMLHGALMGLVACAGGEATMGMTRRWYGARGLKAAQLSIMAVAGGTVSELGGGNFANGAMTAAFAFLFNEIRHHSHSSDNPIGIRIANKANHYVNSTRWAKSASPSGYSKCNIFVQDVLSELGIFDGEYLSAGTWGNPNIDIPGWKIISPDQVQCGDIAAYKYTTSDASGHMGIMFYSNSKSDWTLIYAGSSQHPEQIVKSIFFTPSRAGVQSWFDKYKWIFRRYIGK